MRPIPQAPIAHGPPHMRRESSQSTHSDMSNMGNGPGRSGFPHQGGRGRGYSQSGYQGQQIPYSPNPSFRQTPNQPRGGPNMGPQFHGPNQGRPMGYPNSPHQASRSPALANVNPTTPQMNQAPMAHPQMPPQPYGYGQHMGPQAVRFPPSSFSSRPPQNPPRRGTNRKFSNAKRKEQQQALVNSPEYSMNLAPESGQFEHYLTLMKHQQAYPGGYDPNYAGYYNQAGGYYMTPPSPQPRAAGMPYNNQYMGQQYPAPMPQATPLSRTPSQVSTDRPGSSLGQGSAPTGPAAPGHSHTASRTSNSPVPKPHFIIPSAKKSPIIIKDPNSGSVKTFEKNPASPARATPSPVKFTPPPTATPPPRTASATEHTRSDSKATAAKTDEEKKQELKDAVRLKIQQDEAAQKQRLADEASRKATEAESTPAKKDDTEAARAAIENLSIKDKAAPAEEPKSVAAEEPKKAAPAEEPKKAPAPAPAPVDEEEIDFDAIEREMAEIEAQERAAEESYNKAKAEKKEIAERKEREELTNYEANMKKAEAEAEARELAREAARAGGESTNDDNKDLFASLKKGGLAATETSTPGDSGAATPTSDMGPPAKPASAAPKKPAGLKLDTPKPTEPLQPTPGMKSLQNAKFLVDLSKITYPDSITPPSAGLNDAAPEGRKFHYDRDFLMQFQAAFKDKISVDWDIRLRETVGDANPPSARTPSIGSRNNSSRGGIGGGFPMGTFAAPTGRTGQMPPMGGANLGSRSQSGFGFGRGGPANMGPLSNMRSGSGVGPRAGSKGTGRNDSKAGRSKTSGRKDEEQNKSMPLTAGMDLKAIQTTATGWKPRSVGQAAAGPAPGGNEGYLAPDVVQRKVKAALNKMTPEKFDRIAGQILEIVSQSKDETDGRTLRQVIQLTFEKATDEAHWAPMYAKFCKSMLESMSADIKDENIRDRNGTVVAGGSLFRKYLLNRCQEEFERGWKVNLPDKPEGTTEEVCVSTSQKSRSSVY
jgi:translation initiation factor 4G